MSIEMGRYKGGELWETGDGINVHRGGRVVLAIHHCRKPTIGALNGSAVGVGITMTLPFALRIAPRAAKIGFVFARRGYVEGTLEKLALRLPHTNLGPQHRPRSLLVVLPPASNRILPCARCDDHGRYVSRLLADMGRPVHRSARVAPGRTSPRAGTRGGCGAEYEYREHVLDAGDDVAGEGECGGDAFAG